MARPASKHPTELELAILKILWQGGPLPVRDVRDRLARKLAITSVTTIMNIMVEKGYLAKDKTGPSFVYEPTVTERSTTQRMLKDLVKRAFDGSAAVAMVNLLESSDLDLEEIKRLRQLLNAKRGEARQ